MFDRLDPLRRAPGSRRRASTPTRTASRAASPSSIGPEHGTVGPEQVKEAAKEAVQGVGFDLLVVCGFAFDPHVARGGEALRQAAPCSPARMNPDLAMGDELLKKTGAGNLFMVFGEPDVDDRRQDDGRQARSSRSAASTSTTRRPARSAVIDTDDIACWFIDTDYDGESFFVRHAYFTGADEPYEKLQARPAGRDRRGGLVDALLAPSSRPFAAPESGQDRRQGHQPLRRRGAEGHRNSVTHSMMRDSAPVTED